MPADRETGMTPQERTLVAELFDRLATLENNRRDPEAERLIADGAARAPHALYALVQTVLLQDEALKEAQRRLGETPESQGGFLDPMRRQAGSVPSVTGSSKWNNGGAISRFAESTGAPGNYAPQSQAYAPQAAGAGGSFLGTAAAAALGFLGGNLLFGALRNMGGGGSSAFASPIGGNDQRGPWSDASQGELARDAGLNDIGGAGGDRDAMRSAGLFGGGNDSDSSYDNGDDTFDSDDGFDGGDFGDSGVSDA
jgi:hypothetical protein